MNVLPAVEEEDAVVIENAPIQNHNMVAKIVRTWGLRRRQKTVIKMDVQVNIVTKDIRAKLRRLLCKIFSLWQISE